MNAALGTIQHEGLQGRFTNDAQKGLASLAGAASYVAAEHLLTPAATSPSKRQCSFCAEIILLSLLAPCATVGTPVPL